jgi:mannose-6-phosphate isomerase-like protein (cupin superfamily)
MKRILLSVSVFVGFILFTLSLSLPTLADSSHARIVRLSLIQGDVRFATQFHEDSVTDPKAIWEVAQLNLPIRQGSALSTGNGRAEVEFENGAMAFLGANTIVEFYDLSLNDGDRITRLILRQGSASFHEHSQNADYFSVTGGDFSVAVDGRATFRLENFDDGSALNVLSGRVLVLQNDKSTPLEKGQSLSVHAQDGGKQIIGRGAPNDDFDRWVSSRIQSEEVVNSQVQTNGSYPNYVAGYSDLYTYGAWLPMGGFNYWRPFGVGLGWSPFDSGYGNWYFDQGGLGWSFLGTSPWGWLPYHYGGWILSPAYGWVWNPGGTFTGRPQPYRPVTGVFVRSGNAVAVVPMNVADKPGKTALNSSQGVYPIQSGVVSKSLVTSNEKWSVEKNNSQIAGFTAAPAVAAAPSRVTRTITASNVLGRESTFGRGSSIVYDASARRFVNSSAVNPAQGKIGQPTSAASDLKSVGKNTSPAVSARAGAAPIGTPRGAHTASSASAPRATSMPPRPSAVPAPARTSGGSSGGNSSGSSWGGGRGSSVGAAASSGSSSSSGSSHPSTGGGRPH